MKTQGSGQPEQITSILPGEGGGGGGDNSKSSG